MRHLLAGGHRAGDELQHDGVRSSSATVCMGWRKGGRERRESARECVCVCVRAVSVEGALQLATATTQRKATHCPPHLKQRTRCRSQAVCCLLHAVVLLLEQLFPW